LADWNRFERSINEYTSSLGNTINKYRGKDIQKLRKIKKTYEDVREVLVFLSSAINVNKRKIKDADAYVNTINGHIGTIDKIAADLKEIIREIERGEEKPEAPKTAEKEEAEAEEAKRIAEKEEKEATEAQEKGEPSSVVEKEATEAVSAAAKEEKEAKTLEAKKTAKERKKRGEKRLKTAKERKKRVSKRIKKKDIMEELKEIQIKIEKYHKQGNATKKDIKKIQDEIKKLKDRGAPKEAINVLINNSNKLEVVSEGVKRGLEAGAKIDEVKDLREGWVRTLTIIKNMVSDLAFEKEPLTVLKNQKLPDEYKNKAKKVADLLHEIHNIRKRIYDTSSIMLNTVRREDIKLTVNLFTEWYTETGYYTVLFNNIRQFEDKVAQLDDYDIPELKSYIKSVTAKYKKDLAQIRASELTVLRNRTGQLLRD